MLKFVGGDDLDGVALRYGYATRLFGNDDGQGIGFFGQTKRRAMAKAIRLGDILSLGDRQDTCRSIQTTIGDDESPVVQGCILEEDVFDHLYGYIGIYDLTGIGIFAQSLLIGNHNEGAGFRCRHMRTCQDQAIDLALGILHIAGAGKLLADLLHIDARADAVEEGTDFGLEDDHESNRSDTDKTVEEQASQF